MTKQSRDQQPVIRTVGLTRHFTRNKQTIEAVRGLDLEIAPGELVAFLDPTAPASRRRCGCSPR